MAYGPASSFVHCSLVWRTLGLAACALLPLAASGQASGDKKKSDTDPRVNMVIEKRGTITIELLPKDAPKTVAHFVDLVNKKFYDGILFHRVVAGFVAQAGDPKSKTVKGADIADISPEEAGAKYGLGIGGSGHMVPLEAKAPHERGTLGLARSNDPNSGDSQFFFNLVANHNLDSGYCVFGKIVKGMDVMDKIRQGDKIVSVRVVDTKASTKPDKPKK